jgi:integrase
MARTLRDCKFETRAARERLKARGKPYWRELETGCHLGYRRLRGKPGRWCVRHYAGQQTYQVETIATADDYSDADGVAVLNYRQAQAKARERMAARAHHAAGKRGPLTVRDAVEAYLQFLDSHRKSGYDARHRAEAFILPQLGDIEVQALSTERLRKWHTGLAQIPARLRTKRGGEQQYRKLDPSAEGIRRRRASANRTLTTLKAALNFAWRDGNTPSDGAWRRVRPFEGVDAARIRYLTVAEATRLINSADSEFRPLVQAALQSGARYGELIRLTVSDFHADSGTITIRESKAGKPRHVVLTDEGAAFFRQLCAGRAGSELLFVKANGRPWGTSHQAAPMRAACEHAKIEPRVSFHITRHTYASHCVMNGAPLAVVATNLGHAGIAMIERHYGHLAPSYIADAIRAAAPRFGVKPDRKIAALPVRP